MDASYFRGRHYDHRGLLLLEPALHGRAVFQIQLGAAGHEQIAVARALQRPADGAARHAAVARHEDAISRGDQDRHQPLAPAAATAEVLVGGDSIAPSTLKPLSRRVVVGVQPSFSWAMLGSPSRVSTPAGRK